jgi:hypothetical protein
LKKRHGTAKALKVLEDFNVTVLGIAEMPRLPMARGAFKINPLIRDLARDGSG